MHYANWRPTEKENLWEKNIRNITEMLQAILDKIPLVVQSDNAQPRKNIGRSNNNNNNNNKEK